MQKNVAGQKWVLFAFDRTTSVPKTGDAANITANIRIDGGAANPIDDTNPTELEGGYYIFDVTAAETNGDLIVIHPSSVTADIQVIGVPGSYSPDSLIANVTDILTDTGTTLQAELDAIQAAVITNAAGTDIAADIIALKAVADAVLLDTGTDGVVLTSTGLATSAAGEIADSVWDEALASHLAAGSTGAKLNALDAIGAGEISWTYTLTDAATALPIVDAHVWVTSDIAGATILASGYTNSSGVVTFYMVVGATVYVWRQKDGYSFVNPDTEVIA